LGIVSSIIAISLLSISIYYLESSIVGLNLMADIKLIFTLFSCISGFSIIITSICTYFATQRFLKLKIEQLY